MLNGDIWLDADYSQFSSQHLADSDHAHLWLVDNPPQHPQGDFSLRDDKVEDCPGLTFSGIGIYRPQCFLPLEPGVHKTGTDIATMDGDPASGRVPPSMRIGGILVHQNGCAS